MAMSKAHIKATAKYDAKAYRKVSVRIPKAIEDDFLARAGSSINGYILNLIKKDLGIQDNQKGDENNE